MMKIKNKRISCVLNNFAPEKPPSQSQKIQHIILMLCFKNILILDNILSKY